MVLSDALAKLRAEGIENVRSYRIHHGIAVGNISRPQTDGSGRFVFDERSLDEIRNYLRNIPKPGPRRQPAMAT